MDINEARQTIDDYLRQNPLYSGGIEETSNGFVIIIIKNSVSKPRRGREIEDKKINAELLIGKFLKN